MSGGMVPIARKFNLRVSGALGDVENVDWISFEGIEVGDNGNGDVTVFVPPVPPPFNLTVQDTDDTVSSTEIMFFSGNVDVSELAPGVAEITIPPPPPVSPTPPANPNESIQLNNSGVFGAYSSFKFNGTSLWAPAAFAIGLGGYKTASGSASLGIGASVNGDNCVAISTDLGSGRGNNNVQIVPNGSGGGINAVDNFGWTTCIGAGATARDNSATSIGMQCSANGARSTSLGYQSAAGGSDSIAIGGSSGGDNSVACGGSASASFSATWGKLSNSAHERSGAMGVNSQTRDTHEVAVGFASILSVASLIRFQGVTSTFAIGDYGCIRRGWVDGVNTNATRAGFLSLGGSYLDGFQTGITCEGDAAGAKVSLFGADPILRPTVTGSRGGNAALESLLTALHNLGAITDATTA